MLVVVVERQPLHFCFSMASCEGVDERAAVFANAFLSTMPKTAQLARCRTDLKTMYDESIDAWLPDNDEEPKFRMVLYAMAYGTLEDIPDTKLRVTVKNGWELTWKNIRAPHAQPPERQRSE